MIERKKKKVNWGRASFIFAHLAFGVLSFFVFYVYVNIESVFMAFQRQKDGVKYWTMENFTWFFDALGDKNSVMSTAFFNTFKWFGISLILTVVGFFVSYFLYKKIWFYKGFRVVFFIPGLIPSVVLSMIISNMLGTQGFIAQWMQDLFKLEYVPELLADSQFAFGTLVALRIMLGFPGNLLIWGGTMSRIPETVIEAGKLDGVNWLQEAFLIIVPMILPTVGISLCASLSNVFSANGGEFLYTQGEFGTMTFSTWLYLQILGSSVESNSHNMIAAAGWCTTFVAFPLVLLSRKLINSIEQVEY